MWGSLTNKLIIHIISKNFIAYVVCLVLAILLINEGIEYFLVFAFLILLIKIDYIFNYLKAFQKVMKISIETHIATIGKKVGTTPKDTLSVLDELESLPQEEKDILNESWKIVGGKTPLTK